jgi:hypothetical protein
MAKSGEMQMQEKMVEVFAAADMNMKFWYDRSSSPATWKVTVNGKMVGQARDEARAFQKALDASGIGGTISYTPAGGINWKFRYTPKKG